MHPWSAPTEKDSSAQPQATEQLPVPLPTFVRHDCKVAEEATHAHRGDDYVPMALVEQAAAQRVLHRQSHWSQRVACATGEDSSLAM
jgi:hypothetical protein